ncbi:hypothetical protein FOCG_11685 [Fusarium oxysporum f. sp. radicis-lycopersici 26381]|nr:hypothetical protein FOCG_11685 [Fusarium oxysporum f. sp. radicis-lycopersici 26381]
MKIEENILYKKTIPYFGTEDGFKKRPSKKHSKERHSKTTGG